MNLALKSKSTTPVTTAVTLDEKAVRWALIRAAFSFSATPFD